MKEVFLISHKNGISGFPEVDRLDFRRPLVFGLSSPRSDSRRFGEERGLIPRTAAGNRAWEVDSFGAAQLPRLSEKSGCGPVIMIIRYVPVHGKQS